MATGLPGFRGCSRVRVVAVPAGGRAESGQWLGRAAAPGRETSRHHTCPNLEECAMRGQGGPPHPAALRPPPGSAVQATMMSLPALQTPAPRRFSAFHAQPPQEALPVLVLARMHPARCACCACRADRSCKETGRRAGLSLAGGGLAAAAKPATAASASNDRSCTNSAYRPPSPAWPICEPG